MREFPHSQINRLSQRHESRTKITPAPGNIDCQIVFVALVRSGLIAMFIHEMTVDECSGALKKARLGRLVCVQDNQPYIVPINYVLSYTRRKDDLFFDRS